MECADICPLKPMCDVADDECQQKINERGADAMLHLVEAEGLKECEELHTALVLKVHAAVAEVGAAIAASYLDALGELRRTEEKFCPGPRQIRKYRWFGRVTGVECGSESRRSRIK